MKNIKRFNSLLIAFTIITVIVWVAMIMSGCTDIEQTKETDRYLESIISDSKEENDKVIVDFINNL